MANDLHIGTIAEGIETECQYNYLNNLGCAEGQGYLMSRPLSPPDLLAQLNDNSRTSPPDHGTGQLATPRTPNNLPHQR